MEKIILQNAVNDGLSIRQIQKKFTMSNGSVRYWMKKYQIKSKHNAHTNARWTKENIELAKINSISQSDILRNIGLTLRAGNFLTLQKYSKKFNIVLPIYAGQNAINHLKKKIKDEDLFIENSLTTRATVKRRLIAEGRGKVCEICKNSNIWNGLELTFILDHINGINNDNKKENLRLICPNCNSLLDTHCGKNNKK